MIPIVACSPPPSERSTQSPPAPPPFAEVALSFDELPYQLDIDSAPIVSNPNEQKSITTQMVTALRTANVPATVFVVCGKLPPSQGLAAQWKEEGFTIGNQGHNALNPNLTTLEDWRADIAKCQDKIRKVDTETKGWFRFPHLNQGWTKEKDEALATVLKELNLVSVPASIPILDHLYNTVYEQALREKKNAFAEEIATQYIAHVRQSVSIAKELSFRRRHMTTPHIARFHVNRLNAEHLPRLLQHLNEDGIRFISVHEAMQDPIYHQANTYYGRATKSWLNRVSPRPKIHEKSWFGQAAWRITNQYPQYLGTTDREK